MSSSSSGSVCLHRKRENTGKLEREREMHESQLSGGERGGEVGDLRAIEKQRGSDAVCTYYSAAIIFQQRDCLVEFMRGLLSIGVFMGKS